MPARSVVPNRSWSASRTSGSSAISRWTTSSLERTAAPCRAKAASASLFPAPIPPVSATLRRGFGLFAFGLGFGSRLFGFGLRLGRGLFGLCHGLFGLGRGFGSRLLGSGLLGFGLRLGRGLFGRRLFGRRLFGLCRRNLELGLGLVRNGLRLDSLGLDLVDRARNHLGRVELLDLVVERRCAGLREHFLGQAQRRGALRPRPGLLAL